MRRSLHLFIGSLLVIGSGCSLLFPSDRYVGDGPRDGGDQTVDADTPDAGTIDAGTIDAGPDAPTTPEIQLSPTEAFTDDVLTVQITTESTDPLGGAIAYEYQWLRGTEVALEGETTLPASETTKHEEWRVVVTPVADGERRGAPAEATVTIQNSPPAVTTVALNTYRPVAGQELAAAAGTITDPDGDVPTLEYTWIRDGEILSTPTSSQLPIASSAPPGTEFDVQLTVTDEDGASGSPVTAGPARVLSNESRWRQLWPDRSNIQLVVHDPQHERIVFGIPYGPTSERLWEYDLRHERFVQLRPAGEFSSGWETMRSLGYGAGDRAWFSPLFSNDFKLYSLDLSVRGGEHWETPALTGDVPTGRLYGGIIDTESDLLIALASSGGERSLYSVDLSTGTVSRLTGPLPSAPEGAAWVKIPGTRDVLLVGGSESGNLHRINLDAPADGFVELAARLDASRKIPAAVVDAPRNRIIVGFGVRSDGSAATDWRTIAYDGTGDSELAVSGPLAGSTGIGATIQVDEATGDLIVIPGLEFGSAYAFKLYALDPATGESRVVHAAGENAPPPLRAAVAGEFGSTTYIYGGIDAQDRVQQTVWEFAVDSQGEPTWTKMPDAGSGPGPRYGHSVESGVYHPLIFGGRTDGGLADAAYSWRLTASGWSSYTDPTPVAPVSGGFMYDACGTEVGYIGGTLPPSSTLIAECSGSTCDWSVFATGGAAPSGLPVGPFPHNSQYLVAVDGGMAVHLYDMCTRTWSTPGSVFGTVPVATSGSSVIRGQYVFGGRVGTTSYNDLYQVEIDGSNVRFGPVILAGDSPRPAPRAFQVVLSRAGHTYMYGGVAARAGYGDLEFGDLWELIIR